LEMEVVTKLPPPVFRKTGYTASRSDFPLSFRDMVLEIFFFFFSFSQLAAVSACFFLFYDPPFLLRLSETPIFFSQLLHSGRFLSAARTIECAVRAPPLPAQGFATFLSGFPFSIPFLQSFSL